MFADAVDSLEARLKFSVALLDSARIENKKLEVEITGLEQNQKKWYDEWLIILKIGLMVWIADRLSE